MYKYIFVCVKKRESKRENNNDPLILASRRLMLHFGMLATTDLGTVRRRRNRYLVVQSLGHRCPAVYLHTEKRPKVIHREPLCCSLSELGATKRAHPK